MINDSIWSHDLETEMPVFLCSGEAHAKTFTARTGKRAVPIGPLLHYAPARESPPAERTLVVFPAHSNHRMQVAFDADALCRRLETLQREFPRVLVCVFWKDVLHGLHRPFQARGFSCTSAGHMFDPAFLPRLRQILASASAVLTNEIGSQVFQAALLEKPVWIERQEIRYAPDGAALEAHEFPEYQHLNAARMLALFGERQDTITPAQRAFVDELTGRTHVKPASELRALLLDAEETWQRSLTPRRRARIAWKRGRYWLWYGKTWLDARRR
jgi:hypothetical protein